MNQKKLQNHISCECKCKCDGRTGNSNQEWNNDKYWCQCKSKKASNIYIKRLYLESCYMQLQK